MIASSGLYSRPPDYLDENIQTDLGPEKAWQTALGVEQQIVPGLSAKLTGFFNKKSDLIVRIDDRRDQMQAMSGYDNRGVGRTYGGELMVTLRRGGFFGWTAYTLSRSTRRDDPDGPTRLFDFDQTHNLIVLGSQSLGRWRIGGRFQYTTGSPTTPLIGAEFDSDRNAYMPQYGAVNSRRLEAQHQLDVRIDRSFTLGPFAMSAYLDVSNVYLNAATVDVDYNFDYTERSDIKGLPIVPSLGLRGEFQ